MMIFKELLELVVQDQEHIELLKLFLIVVSRMMHQFMGLGLKAEIRWQVWDKYSVLDQVLIITRKLWEKMDPRDLCQRGDQKVRDRIQQIQDLDLILRKENSLLRRCLSIVLVLLKEMEH